MPRRTLCVRVAVRRKLCRGERSPPRHSPAGSDGALWLGPQPATVSGERQDGTPVSRLIDALDVERHAKVGVVVGFGFALLGVLLISSSPYRGGFGARDLVLGFVVVVSTALMVTVLLTVRSVVRLTMSPPKWIRRGGAVAMGAALVVAVLGLLGPLVGTGPLEPVYARVLPLASIGLLYGVWAVHAANRRRYGTFGLVGAVLAGVGVVLLAWFTAIETGAYLGGELERFRPAAVRGVSLSASSVFLAGNLAALAGTTVLGLALLRAGTLPERAALALTFSFPVSLGGLTVAASIQFPGLLSLALLVPTALAWIAVGYALRNGRGVPPAEFFEVEVREDPTTED